MSCVGGEKVAVIGSMYPTSGNHAVFDQEEEQ